MNKRNAGNSLDGVLSLYSRITDLKRQIDNFSEASSENEGRMTDLEVHINLLTRLLTTLCIEKFGMRIGVLKRLVKRIEKEAVRDSQILELESLYRLSHGTQKKPSSAPSKPTEDPWDKIS